MNTWWIVRDGDKLIITRYNWFRDAVGPYWSVAEALKMIEKWR